MRARTALGGLAAAAALAVAGCGGGSGGQTKTSTVQTTTTKVEVLRDAGEREGGFDPQGIYQRESPGVVTVISTGLEAAGRDDAAGLGSGFVISGKGEIATNAHVVTSGEGAAIRKASNVFVRFADGNQVPAEVKGFDPFADVALLKINPDGLTLRPLPLGSTKDLHVGAPVAAIGSPFGEEQSLSVGVISAINRSVKSLTQFQIEGAIQTDAAINPGNSGGPLLDANANVIGINQQIETRSNTNSGVGFAVPVSQIKRSLPQLRQGGKAEYAYIGVSSQALYPQLARHLGLDTSYGGLIARIVPGGPAADAGLKGGDHTVRFQASRVRTGGDVILAVDGKKVVLPDDLARFVSAYKPGDKVTLQVLKDGAKQNIEVTLGTRPTSISG